LREVVSEADHGCPSVAVEVVDCSSGADDEVVLVAEGPERGAYFHVEVRIETGVHGDYGGWWTAVGEHADQDEVGVVDPVEVRVALDVEALGFEHLDAAVCGRDVGVEFVVLVLGRVHVGDWRFARCRIGRYLDFVIETVPVCSLELISYWLELPRRQKYQPPTIIMTPFIPCARASSPHFFQYVADSHSSPSIMVEPWEKKCTGVGSAIVRIRKSKLLAGCQLGY
jgi:hypothetical protein